MKFRVMRRDAMSQQILAGGIRAGSMWWVVIRPEVNGMMIVISPEPSRRRVVPYEVFTFSYPYQMSSTFDGQPVPRLGTMIPLAGIGESVRQYPLAMQMGKCVQFSAMVLYNHDSGAFEPHYAVPRAWREITEYGQYTQATILIPAVDMVAFCVEAAHYLCNCMADTEYGVNPEAGI